MKTRRTYEWLIEYTSHTVGVAAKEAKLILEYIEQKEVSSLGKYNPSILLPMIHVLSGGTWWAADGISLVALKYGLASIDPLCKVLWKGLDLDFFWTELFQDAKGIAGGPMCVWQTRVERAGWLSAVGIKNVLRWAIYDKGWGNLTEEEKSYVGTAISLARRILTWGEIEKWKEAHARNCTRWDSDDDIRATEKVLRDIYEMGKGLPGL